MDLPAAVRIKCDGMRAIVRTTTEALRLIDEDLPMELRGLPRWTLARGLLVTADKTSKKRDVLAAARQLSQALRSEGWLAR